MKKSRKVRNGFRTSLLKNSQFSHLSHFFASSERGVAKYWKLLQIFKTASKTVVLAMFSKVKGYSVATHEFAYCYLNPSELWILSIVLK
jgi:hypothetical protein